MATKTKTAEVDVFPAPAGVILEDALAARMSSSFPRTCGGDPRVNAVVTIF